jgi:hypothetical protein
MGIRWQNEATIPVSLNTFRIRGWTYLFCLFARPSYIRYHAVNETNKPVTPPHLRSTLLGAPDSSVQRLATPSNSQVQFTRRQSVREKTFDFMVHRVIATEKMKNPYDMLALNDPSSSW